MTQRGFPVVIGPTNMSFTSLWYRVFVCVFCAPRDENKHDSYFQSVLNLGRHIWCTSVNSTFFSRDRASEFSPGGSRRTTPPHLPIEPGEKSWGVPRVVRGARVMRTNMIPFFICPKFRTPYVVYVGQFDFFPSR